MTSEPGKATLLAILNEVRAGREDVKAAVTDHEARIRVLERKNMKVSAVVSGIVSIIVALATLFAGGCVPAPTASTLSREATVQVEVVGLTEYGVAGWSGTGWYIADHILATAGHVCEGSTLYTTYSTSDGQDATVIYDHDTYGVDDVCLLYVDKPGKVLGIGAMPADGDLVMYTGYPSGTRGTYHGEVSGIEEDGTILVSIAAYGGASGSAVLDEETGRVIGMLVLGDFRFTHHVWLVPPASLIAARDFARDYLDKLRDEPWTTVTNTLINGALETWDDAGQ